MGKATGKPKSDEAEIEAGMTGGGTQASLRLGEPTERASHDPRGGTDTRTRTPREQAKAAGLPTDVGWLLVMGGLIGVVAPGVLGLDMLALGALILWPGNRRRLTLWLEGPQSAPRFLRGSMKQVARFLEDLEDRYPRNGKG